MSETGTPYYGSSGPQFASATGTTGTTGTGTDSTGVKERVTSAAADAAEAGRNVADDARHKAHDVAHEASRQAHGLLDRTRTELGSRARGQQQRAAETLHAMENELGRMAGASDDPGLATDLVRRAGDATGQAARWLEDREPGAILGEIEDFARRRPGMFIALSAGAGILVGRFLRGMKDANGSSDDPASPHDAPGAPGLPAVPPAGTTPGTVPAAPGGVPGTWAEPAVPGGTAPPSAPPPSTPPTAPPPAPGGPLGGGAHV